MVTPGSPRKAEYWQILAGDCSDPLAQDQAKKNLVRGLANVFGWDLGVQLSSVNIECGMPERKKLGMRRR